MLLLKTAILVEWRRIFTPHHARDKFFWATTIAMGVNVAFYICVIATTIGGCRPVERPWHFWLSGTCIDRKARDVVSASFNLIMDVLILILPQKIIWNLQMSRRRKIGLSIVFSVGLLYAPRKSSSGLVKRG